MIRLICPEDGASVSVMTERQTAFVNEYRTGTHPYFTDEEKDRDDSAPAVTVFRWRSDAGPGTLEFSLTEDFSVGAPASVGAVVSTGDGEYEASVTNFFIGRKYFWRVRAGGGTSEIRSFYSRNDGFRVIGVEHVPNFRDIGGRFNRDGRRVKQGLLYRGTYLEKWEDGGLTEKGRETFVRDLGIRTELDLREEKLGKLTESPAGDGVRFVLVPHDSSWGGTFNDRGMGQMREIFDVLFDPSSYPVFFHCFSGADRTGFVGVVVDAFLGMSDGEIKLGYAFTSLFEERIWDQCEGARDYFAFLVEQYGERSLSELVTLHFTNSGIDADKIARFRDFMLE